MQADIVLRQVPAAGTQCEPGDIIQVVVSGGLVNVPNVANKSLAEARAMLSDAGLNVSTSITYTDSSDTRLHGLVAGQTPAQGSQVIQSTMVYLTLYQVPGMTKSCDVILKLPEKNETITVRVTLVVDGMESVQVQRNVAPEESRHPRVTLSAQIAGEYTYRVYCNGTFAYEETALLE